MSYTDLKCYYHRTYNNTSMFEGHKHGGYEANIVLKGSLELTVGSRVLKLFPGDMALWAPQIFHCNRAISDGTTEFLSLHFTYSKETTDDFIGFYRLNSNNMILVNILIEEAEKDKSPDKINDAAKAIFEALLLRCRQDSETPFFANNSSAIIFREAISIMNEDLSKMLSVPEIAHHCGICETTLKNVFKHHTGKSVKKYYCDLKIDKAITMLSEGVSANTVASALGFSSLSYFSQCFKRETGHNIRDYIKNNINEL